LEGESVAGVIEWRVYIFIGEGQPKHHQFSSTST